MAETAAQRHGLEVQENRPWQERMWTAQRIAWLLMALFIAAAIAGLTGKGGALASATARSSAATIHYPRITRWQSDEQVTLRLPASASGEVEVLLSSAFVDVFSIDSIIPEPVESQASGGGQRLTFEVGAGGGEKAIVFNVTAGKPVIARPVEAKVGDGPEARIAITVLP